MSKGLSNVQLTRHLAPRLADFRGVFSKDTLPAYLEPGSYIINMQDHDQGDGTHWTCFKQKAGCCLYFDPFGVVPPLSVQLKTRGPLWYSTAAIQGLSSDNCGRFCCYALLQLAKGRSFADIARDFTADGKVNDRIVEAAYRV